MRSYRWVFQGVFQIGSGEGLLGSAVVKVLVQRARIRTPKLSGPADADQIELLVLQLVGREGGGRVGVGATPEQAIH